MAYYRFGQRKKRGAKANLFWVVVFALTFFLGATASAAVLLRINKAYGLTGLKEEKKEETTAVKANENNITASEEEAAKVAAAQAKAASATKPVGGQVGIRVADCGGGSVHPGLSSSSVPQLRALAEYEEVCGAVSKASFFVGTPGDQSSAVGEAAWVASVLKEFSRLGIFPLVFLEPVTSAGVVNYDNYRNGGYDSAMDSYFASLKSQGVTDAMMGTWVPFPEGNIPVWGNTDPGYFAANVTKTVQFQKKHFPSSKAAVLLESKSYPSGTSWSGGSYKSLLPYISGIPSGLIDSFGLQGFSWPPTSPGDVPLIDPKVFLRVDLAAEAARALSVNEVWLNTGTFGRAFNVSRTNPFTMTPAQRQAILSGIATQAKTLRAQGFSTAVHLFSEDKSALSEGIDWSYWQHGQSATSETTTVFKTFVSDLKASGTGLWIFDTK